MHSWVAENRSSVRTMSDSSEEDENFDERISDIIANTIDGDSRPRHQQQPERTESYTERSERRPQASPHTQLSSAASAPSVLSEDTFEVHFREKIQMHPQPGNAANKLNRLVNMPFRAQFGTESRVQSSRERELEQQRAASSLKPAFTPLLKDNEAELIIGDSPRETPNPTRIEQQQQRTSQSQKQKPQTSSSTQIQQPIQIQSRQQLQDENQNRAWRTQQQQQPQISITRFMDRSTQTPPPPSHQFLTPSPPFRSPPHLPSPSPIPDHRPRNSVAQHDWRPRTRSLSISDFPPLYNLNRRPHVPPPINVDSWALGVGHYRRMYLDNMVRRVRESEEHRAKLEAKLSRFDKQNKQELNELELMHREQELELRRRQLDERLREQEELERRMAARTNLAPNPTPLARSQIGQIRPPPPPLHSILKKPLAPPPSNSAAATGRVAFSSPIRSINLYSPNRSGANSSSLAAEEVQLENEPACSQNIAGSSANNQQRMAPQNNPLSRRLALTNQTNNNNVYSGQSTARNVQNEREKEGKRMDYLSKWQQNRQQLVEAKRQNSRINLKSNPTSIFQHIPAHPTRS